MESQKNIRIIPRLDIKGPNLIKGLAFEGHRVLGTPEYFAERYYLEGADELIFYDSVASLYQRNTLLEYVRKTAERIFIPLTVAGGIRSIQNIRDILRAGADKVAINTAAVSNPNLLREGARIFGTQCIVSCIEFHSRRKGGCEVWVDYGRQPTGLDALDWAKRVVDLGAGEILLISVERDGMGEGFDIDFTRKVATAVSVPVIACGGAGEKEDFVKVIRDGQADAVSAASVFHYQYARQVDSLWMSFNEARLRMGEQVDSGNIDFLNYGHGGFREIMCDLVTVPELKEFLMAQGIKIRPLARRAARAQEIHSEAKSST